MYTLTPINPTTVLNNDTLGARIQSVSNAAPQTTEGTNGVFTAIVTKDKRTENFDDIFKKFDEEKRKMNEEYEREMKLMEERRAQRKLLKRRLVEIDSMIAHYKFKLSLDKDDKTATAMVSTLTAKATRLIVWG